MKSRVIILLYVTVIAIVACKKRQPPAPRTAAPASAAVVTTAEPRDLTGANIKVTLPLLPNAVAKCAPVKNEIAAGDPIELSMTLNESPEGLVVASRLLEDDKAIAYATRPAYGSKSVSISMRPDVKPGTYMLEGYWGGNLVCEHEVKIR